MSSQFRCGMSAAELVYNEMILYKNISGENISGDGYSVSVGTAGQMACTGGAADDGAAAAGAGPCLSPVDDPCAGAANADRPDLTWLLHRAAQHMRTGLDEAARSHGLAGARDWIVLSALAAGPRQTQLSLGQSLGLDKTTMTSLLDRMEARGLITRSTDRRDRRARIPALTGAGRQIQAEVTGARDCVEAGLLSGFTADEQRQLRDLLTRLTVAPSAHGSCI
jgi:MarR family transcriptional regulator, organic hydroperoxide resistance regulator